MCAAADYNVPTRRPIDHHPLIFAPVAPRLDRLIVTGGSQHLSGVFPGSPPLLVRRGDGAESKCVGPGLDLGEARNIQSSLSRYWTERNPQAR